MPSKSLSVLPSTPSPTALFAQTAHSRQILTPLLSFTSALLFHSLAARGKSSRVFPTPCALFAKKTGVYPSRHFPAFAIQLLTALESILTETHSCKPFRMNTYKKQGEGGRGGLPTSSDLPLPSLDSSGLRRWREESDRQVPRRPQSRRRTQNHWNRIHGHARRRNISMRPARNRQRNIRMPAQRNRVRRIFRANVHLQFHVHQFFSAAQSARNLVYARRLSRLNRQKFRRHFFRRHFRFNRFGNFVNGQSQTVRDHRDRLRQSHVLDRSFLHARAKFLHAQSRANLFLQRQSPLRRVHNSQRLRMFDLLRHCAQRNRQLVHHESRIHARSDQRHTPFFRRRIQLRGKFRIGPVRIRKLLARRNHARLRFQTCQQLLHHLRQRRRSRVHHHVRRLSQHFRCIRRNFHAPRRVARANHFTQIPSHFCRVVINRADNLYGLLLAHQLHNRSSDRPNAILNRAYFLFHNCSPLRRCKHTPRILGAKESSKIMDSPIARNARRSSLSTFVQSLRPFLARTIMNSPSVPEALYASAQTHRRRNRETDDPAAWLANSKRQTPSRVRVQGFCHRFRQHDARCAHRRIDESPPRVV